MPTVNQQSGTKRAATKPVKPASIFDGLIDLETSQVTSVRMSIYGKAKTGKTRLISTFPKPILIIGADIGEKSGTASISGIEGIKFWPVKQSEEAFQLVEGAHAQGFATVAVDTASMMADIFLKEILGLTDVPAHKMWGLATREQYGQQVLKMKTFLRKVLELPEPMNVAIVTHERNFNSGDDGGSVTQGINPSVGSALSPQVAAWLNGAVDYLCQTYIDEKTELKTVTVGNERIEKVVGTGVPEYSLRIGSHPVYMTGFRLSPRFTLPEKIVEPDYGKIMRVIRGQKL